MPAWLRRHRVKLIGLGTVVALVLVLYGLRGPILTGIGHYVVIRDEVSPADLIAVMHAEWWEVDYALDLYRDGHAPQVLFVGREPTELAVPEGEGFRVVAKPWNEIVQGIARAEGLPDDAVLTSPKQTKSTYEQTSLVLSTAKAEGARSVIVVSDPLHMRRIAWSADRLREEEDVKLTFAPVPNGYYPPDERYHPDRWWRDEYSTKVLFGEYVKLLYYWFNY